MCVYVGVFACKVAAVSWMLPLETGLHCPLTQLSSNYNVWCVCLCEACACLFAAASHARVPSAIARNPPITPKSRDVFLTTQASSSGRCTCSDERTGGDSFVFTQGLVSGGCGEGLSWRPSGLKSAASCHRSTCFLISARGATHHTRTGIRTNYECFEYLGCCLLQSTLGTQPTVLNEFAQTVSVVLIRDFLIVFLYTSATVSPGAE